VISLHPSMRTRPGVALRRGRIGWASLLALAAPLGAAVLAGVWWAGSHVEPLPPHPFFAQPGPRVIAHRGGRGLWPENTLYAFGRAAALGVDVLEMDVRQTSDGQVVVIHDDTVDRTTDGHGPVATMTLAELQRLDAGYRWSADEGRSFPYRGQGIVIPTLREVFAALPHARMNVEIKDRATSSVAPLCKLIREQGMQQRVLVVAVQQDAIDAFRAACPEVATAATRNEVIRFTACSAAFVPGCASRRAQALQVPERMGRFELLSPRFVRNARRLNLRLEVWTVNDAEAMHRLLALPVDGVMTDYPDRMLALLGR
jgi:glycerophosphoryl diester phosphodiesterase